MFPRPVIGPPGILLLQGVNEAPQGHAHSEPYVFTEVAAKPCLDVSLLEIANVQRTSLIRNEGWLIPGIWFDHVYEDLNLASPF